MGDAKEIKTLASMAAETQRLEAGGRRGIACPACGCFDLRVQTTRRSDNMVIRYRVCRHCGQHRATVES